MEKINRHNYEAYFLDFAEGNLDDAQISQLEAFLEAHPELRSELDSFDPVILSDADNHSADWGNLKKPTLRDLQNDKTLREKFFTRAIEGMLSTFELETLEKLSENKTYADELESWKKTILTARSEEKINADTLYQFGLDRTLSETNYEAWLSAKTEGLLNADQLEELYAFAKKRNSGERDLNLAENLRLKPAQGIFYPDKTELYQSEKRKIISLWIYRAAAVAAVLLLGFFLWTQRETPLESNRPIALKPKPATPMENDTSKTGKQAPPDTLKEVKSQKAPKLEEWQLREPEPVYYAQNNSTQADRVKTGNKKLRGISPKKNSSVAVGAIEPQLALASASEIKTPKKNQDPVAARDEEYKTIPQLAEKALAEKLDIQDTNREDIATVVAQRLTDKVSKMLDADFKSKSTEDQTISYTLRIGKFEFSQTKNK